MAGGHRARPGQLDHRAGILTAGPGQQARLVLTRDDGIGGRPDGEIPAHLRVESVEAQRQLWSPAPDRLGDAERQAHRGVHRHRECDPVGPINGDSVERVDGEVDAADVVAGSQQRAAGIANCSGWWPSS